jgi:hypothetical protein
MQIERSLKSREENDLAFIKIPLMKKEGCHRGTVISKTHDNPFGDFSVVFLTGKASAF